MSAYTGKTIGPMNCDEKNNTNSLAEHNRKVLKPSMMMLVNRLYQELDTAAVNGVRFEEGLDQSTIDNIIGQLLMQIQIDYQGTKFEERNILENIVFYSGTLIGYPLELVNNILRAIPLSAHFRAGVQNGKVISNLHLNKMYNWFSTTKENIMEETAKVIENPTPVTA